MYSRSKFTYTLSRRLKLLPSLVIVTEPGIPLSRYYTYTNQQSFKMAEFKEDLDKSAGQAGKTHKIRITLTSRNVKPLEKCRSPSIFVIRRVLIIQSVVILSTEPRTGTSTSRDPFDSPPRSSSTPPERRKSTCFDAMEDGS